MKRPRRRTGAGSRPGRDQLFVVGDPKQSIYRFRRADIETYGAVRARIEKSGRVLNALDQLPLDGPALRLDQHAPSARQFPARGDAAAGRVGPARGAAGRGSARRLSPRVADADRGHGAARRARTRTRIARAIEAAVRERRPPARGLPHPLPHAQAHVGLRPGARGARDPVRALRRRRVQGLGGARGRCCPCSRPLSDPDDPVPFVAVLRGPLFGVDDEALYRFSRAGGRFSLPRRAARGRRPADRAGLRAPAGGRGARGARCRPRRRSRSSAAASAGPRYGAARELGDSRAGNLLKAIAAARTFSAEGLDFAAVVARARPARRARATSRR